MQEFKKRRSGREDIVRFALGLFGVAALALLALFSVRAAWGMYGKLSEASQAQDAAQSELRSLQQQQASIGATVSALSSPRGQESAVRARFGVALPGEGEIDIVERAMPAAEATSTPKAGLLERLFHALFPF